MSAPFANRLKQHLHSRQASQDQAMPGKQPKQVNSLLRKQQYDNFLQNESLGLFYPKGKPQGLMIQSDQVTQSSQQQTPKLAGSAFQMKTVNYESSSQNNKQKSSQDPGISMPVSAPYSSQDYIVPDSRAESSFSNSKKGKPQQSPYVSGVPNPQLHGANSSNMTLQFVHQSSHLPSNHNSQPMSLVDMSEESANRADQKFPTFQSFEELPKEEIAVPDGSYKFSPNQVSKDTPTRSHMTFVDGNDQIGSGLPTAKKIYFKNSSGPGSNPGTGSGVAAVVGAGLRLNPPSHSSSAKEANIFLHNSNSNRVREDHFSTRFRVPNEPNPYAPAQQQKPGGLHSHAHFSYGSHQSLSRDSRVNFQMPETLNVNSSLESKAFQELGDPHYQQQVDQRNYEPIVSFKATPTKPGGFAPPKINTIGGHHFSPDRSMHMTSQMAPGRNALMTAMSSGVAASKKSQKMVKKIIRKRKSVDLGARPKTMLAVPTKKPEYEVTTIKRNFDGSEVIRVENMAHDPNIDRINPHLTPTQRMLVNAIKPRDHSNSPNQTDYLRNSISSAFESANPGGRNYDSRMVSRLSNLSSTKMSHNSQNFDSSLVSLVVDLNKVQSIKKIDTTAHDCKIFIEQAGQAHLSNDYDDKSHTFKPKRKRQKITIIKQKKHRDGSVSSTRQDIYKNYGDAFASRTQKRYNQTMTDLSSQIDGTSQSNEFVPSFNRVGRINQELIQNQMHETAPQSIELFDKSRNQGKRYGSALGVHQRGNYRENLLNRGEASRAASQQSQPGGIDPLINAESVKSLIDQIKDQEQEIQNLERKLRMQKAQPGPGGKKGKRKGPKVQQLSDTEAESSQRLRRSKLKQPPPLRKSIDSTPQRKEAHKRSTDLISQPHEEEVKILSSEAHNEPLIQSAKSNTQNAIIQPEELSNDGEDLKPKPWSDIKLIEGKQLLHLQKKSFFTSDDIENLNMLSQREDWRVRFLQKKPALQNQISFASTFYTRMGNQIQLPGFDFSYYVEYFETLFFSKSIDLRRELIMQPLPPQVGQIFFCIRRNKSMLNKMAPKFELYLEKGAGQRLLILFAEKKMLTVNGYYLIQLGSKNKSLSRNSNLCLGKLRAVDNEKDKYVLYDNGESYDSKKLNFDLSNLRREMGAFLFRYELCNVGNIRKMRVMLPQIYAQYLDNEGQVIDTSDQLLKKGSPAKKKELPLDQEYNLNFVIEDYRPKYDHESILRVHDKQQRKNPVQDYENQKKAVQADRFRTFVDNPPSWNPKVNSYVYNFKGRVSEASIKNFQLIPQGFKKDIADANQSQGQHSSVSSMGNPPRQDFLLQFGKRNSEEFIMDAQFPISIFQAFGLALSAFDAE